MTGEDFKNWLKLYGQAWEDKDAKRFSELFANEANYFLSPFENPLTGTLDIETAIEEKYLTQDNIKFNYQIISFAENIGVCKWWCKFIRNSTHNLIKLDGVFICEFDKNNLCKTFNEWWHKDGESGQ